MRLDHVILAAFCMALVGVIATNLLQEILRLVFP